MFEFDEHSQLHLVDLTLSLDQLLVLNLDSVHLHAELRIEILVVFLLEHQVLLEELDFLPVLLHRREDAGVKHVRAADAMVRVSDLGGSVLLLRGHTLRESLA